MAKLQNSLSFEQYWLRRDSSAYRLYWQAAQQYKALVGEARASPSVFGSELDSVKKDKELLIARVTQIHLERGSIKKGGHDCWNAVASVPHLTCIGILLGS